MKYKVFSLLILFSGTIFLPNANIYAKETDASQLVDIIIFSRNRPLQVDALLESAHKLVTGIGDINLLYRADTEQFEEAYQKIANDYNNVILYRQYTDKEFEEYLMKMIFKTGHEYVCFMVDDDLFIEDVDLRVCSQMLDKHSAYAFRMEMGIKRNYHFFSHHIAPLPPSLTIVDDGVYSWTLKETPGSHWKWVCGTDAVVYKKANIEKEFRILEKQGAFLKATWFHVPWQHMADERPHDRILCFEQAKIINVCVNTVGDDQFQYLPQFSEEWVNNEMNNYSPEALLAVFHAGKKIDIDHIGEIGRKSNCPFVETGYKFIDR